MVKAQHSISPVPEAELAKALGAFYTDAQIADFLIWWAVRSPLDKVMDPSFGGGVFLRAASAAIIKLGGQPETQIFGVEIDSDVHSGIADKLLEEFGVPRRNLLLGDFFSFDASQERQVDVIVGN